MSTTDDPAILTLIKAAQAWLIAKRAVQAGADRAETLDVLEAALMAAIAALP